MTPTLHADFAQRFSALAHPPEIQRALKKWEEDTLPPRTVSLQSKNLGSASDTAVILVAKRFSADLTLSSEDVARKTVALLATPLPANLTGEQALLLAELTNWVEVLRTCLSPTPVLLVAQAQRYFRLVLTPPQESLLLVEEEKVREADSFRITFRQEAYLLTEGHASLYRNLISSPTYPGVTWSIQPLDSFLTSSEVEGLLTFWDPAQDGPLSSAKEALALAREV